LAEEKKDPLEIVVEDFKRAQEARQPREDKWKRYYELYRSYVENRSDGLSNLFIPLVFAAIETVLPRLVEAIFASRPYLAVLPREPQDVDNARVMETLIDYQLVDKMNIVRKFNNWIRECLIYGTAVGKVGWRFETRPRIVRVPRLEIFGVKFGETTKEEQTVFYDDPDFEPIDLFDFFIDPDATTIDEAAFCIHRFYRSMSYLKKQAENGIYENIDELEELTASGTITSNERISDIGLGGGTSGKKLEVLEYWTDDRVITVVEQQVVIRDAKNPYYHRRKPFISIVDVPVPHEFYGIGEVEPIEYLQYAYNDFVNQIMDNINLSINKVWVANKEADIDPTQLTVKPGHVIWAEDIHNDLREVVFADNTGSAFNMLGLMENQIQNVLGVFDYIKGATPSRAETATTVTSLQEAANMRFKQKIRTIEIMGLRDLGRFMIQLNQQFVDRTRLIRVVGAEGEMFQEISPEEIGGDFDLIPVGSSVDPIANKFSRQNQLINLYNTIGQHPIINQQEFLKIIFDAFDVKEQSRLINPMQMMPQQQGAGEPMPQIPPDIPPIEGQELPPAPMAPEGEPLPIDPALMPPEGGPALE